MVLLRREDRRRLRHAASVARETAAISYADWRRSGGGAGGGSGRSHLHPHTSPSSFFSFFSPSISRARITIQTAPLPPSSCFPGERASLCRRPGTWFAKPAVVGPVPCSRRGWSNVEADTLECDFCKSRLILRVPASATRDEVGDLISSTVHPSALLAYFLIRRDSV